jgi:hypothetical protein
VKALAGIVVIALLGLIMFGVAAYTVTENPKIKVKLALEREMRVKVKPPETVTDPGTRRVTLRLRVAPTAGTLTADQVGALATRAAAILASQEAGAPEYDALEVLPAGDPPVAFERRELELRVHFEARLPEAEKALAKAWGAPVHLEARWQRARLGGKELGVALAERPPGDRADADLADDALAPLPLAAFASIPAREPSAPPAVLRRSGRR